MIRVLLLGVLLAGCGGAAADNAAGDARGTAELRPTPTPTPARSEPEVISPDQLPDVPATPGDTKTTGLPADVVAFKLRRDRCDHFRGEAPYNAARARVLRDRLAKNCNGTDRDLATLRRRYARKPPVLTSLKVYEDKVE